MRLTKSPSTFTSPRRGHSLSGPGPPEGRPPAGPFVPLPGDCGMRSKAAGVWRSPDCQRPGTTPSGGSSLRSWAWPTRPLIALRLKIEGKRWGWSICCPGPGALQRPSRPPAQPAAGTLRHRHGQRPQAPEVVRLKEQLAMDNATEPGADATSPGTSWERKRAEGRHVPGRSGRPPSTRRSC
jgi:hypothetical protein